MLRKVMRGTGARMTYDEYDVDRINGSTLNFFDCERALEELLRLFAHGFRVLFTAKTPKLNVVENDPDDDKFIECAVALHSEFIISGDKALGSIKNYMGIKIQSPKQFLDEVSRLKR